MLDDVRAEEFRACYVELYPKVAAYLWSLTRDRETAHDLAQETFARLFDRWTRVDEPSPYAYRIATNLAHRSWRQSSRAGAALRDIEDRSLPMADHAEAVDLRLAVDTLPRRHRQVVLLHYYADLPVATIASTLGRPAGTVKRQLSEARDLLAGAFGAAP